MKRLVWLIALGILAVLLVYASVNPECSHWFDKPKAQCYHWLIYGFAPEDNTISLCSKTIDIDKVRMAKSSVDRELVGGGAVIKWKVASDSDAGDLLRFTVSFGPCSVIVDSPTLGAGTVTYRVTLNVSPQTAMPPLSTVYYYTIELPPSGFAVGSIPVAWYPTGSAYLRTIHNTTPIGDKVATHAKECSITEDWVATNVPIYIYTDDASLTATAAIIPNNLFGVSCEVDPDNWPDVGKYAVWAEEISFAGEMIDFGDSYPVRDVSPSPESYHIWEEGVGSTIGWWGDNSGGNYTLTSAVVTPPFRYDTTNMWIGGMDDVEVPDTLLIGCTGVRDVNEETREDEGDLIQTYGEWKAFSRQQQRGIHTKDSRPPELTKDVKFYIIRESAIEHGISPGIISCDYRVQGAGLEKANGDYFRLGTANGRPVYSNGVTYLWSDGEFWYISAGIGRPAWYVTLLEAVDPDDEEYFFSDWIDTLDPETGEWVLGIGPLPTVTDDPTFVAESDGTISFKNDLDIPIMFWTLSATTRTESPVVTDVFRIGHKQNIGIYASALNHQSWVGNGCSTPDVSGVFEVQSAGGSLTLTIPNTYERRLSSEVQALVAAAGVPNAYWYRDVDHYYNQGTPPAEREGVWDWRMWGYLQQGFEVMGESPLPTVSVEIQYKNDLNGMGDNHYTDSTRQTEFVYTPGDTYTLSRTVEIVYKDSETNLCGALFDLFDENPLAIVNSIKLTFAETGTYRIIEPALVLDPGDRNEVTNTSPFYREAPEGHSEIKEFESWMYADGGVSGHTDGMYNMALYWPDSKKPNQVEKTGGHLLVRYSKSTGGDFTVAFSAAQYASLMQYSCNALDVSYSQAAEDSHYKDYEGTSLKTPACFDIVPFMHNGIDDNVYLDMCVMVGQCECVNGLEYKFHTKKYVGGQIHGMLHKDGETKRARTTGNVITASKKRTDATNYTTVEELGSDEHGHYRTESYSLIDNQYPTVFYDYQIKGKNKAAVYIGQLATREFNSEDLLYKSKAIKLSNLRDKYGILVGTDISDAVELYLSVNNGRTATKTITVDGTSPSLCDNVDRILSTDTRLVNLPDFGRNAQETIMSLSISGDNLSMFGDGKRLVMLYINNGLLYCALSNNSGKSFDIADKVVASAVNEDQYATGLFLDDGSLLVCYHKSGDTVVSGSISKDGGLTWEETFNAN